MNQLKKETKMGAFNAPNFILSLPPQEDGTTDEMVILLVKHKLAKIMRKIREESNIDVKKNV